MAEDKARESNKLGDFECNICFDLARDPVVTLCGHLHCWPCLYKWLKYYSVARDCPVCKARIDIQTLIPLHGKGLEPSDPRSKPLQEGVAIPGRMSWSMPVAVDDAVFGWAVRFVPVAITRVFGMQFHEFSDVNLSGGGDDYEHLDSFDEGGMNRETEINGGENWKRVLYFILVFVVFGLLVL